MLKLVRVDHRLLHGQVVFKWSKMLDIDCILIANDQVVKDELRMSALRLAKPETCKLVIKSVDDSVRELNSQVTDRYRLLVITETIEDAYRLARQVPQIRYINLGGTRMMEGRRQISKAVFVSEQDIERLKELNSSGVQTQIQMVPDDVPEDASKLI